MAIRMPTRRYALLVALLAPLALAVACEEEGPAEEAGEAVDEAVEETGEAVEEAGEGTQ